MKTKNHKRDPRDDYSRAISLVTAGIINEPNPLAIYRDKLKATRKGDPIPSSLGLPLFESFLIFSAYAPR